MRPAAVGDWVAARLKARADRAGRLVAGQQALAGGHHGGGGGAQLLGVLAIVDRRSVGRAHHDGAAANDRRGRAKVERERGADEGEHDRANKRAPGSPWIRRAAIEAEGCQDRLGTIGGNTGRLCLLARHARRRPSLRRSPASPPPASLASRPLPGPALQAPAAGRSHVRLGSCGGLQLVWYQYVPL